MADYEIRYQLNQRPQPRTDGSGCVDHDLWIEYRVEGSGDPWATVPEKHRIVSVPAADIQAALSTGTNAQKGVAYKQALAANLDTAPVAIIGWSAANVENQLDANDAASTAASSANEFITVDLDLSYPVSFNI